MPLHHEPQQNRLLTNLSADTKNRLIPFLKLVVLRQGAVLHEAEQRASHIYFPNDAVVALCNVMESGAATETSIVGNEGIVGTALLMGGVGPVSRAEVCIAGTAYQLPTQYVKEEFDRHGELLSSILRYTQFMIAQMGQTAACNRHHSIEQQVCRLLLLLLDRLPGSKVEMTQELIACMLGVRRESITAAAGKLHKLGVITYSRGHIAVHQRDQLERLSCECYAVLHKECDRLIPQAANALQLSVEQTSPLTATAAARGVRAAPLSQTHHAQWTAVPEVT